MTIKYLDQTFLGFHEYIEHNARVGVSGVATTPVYARPVDKWIISTLNSTPVKAVINKAMDAVVSLQFGHELASSVFIDQKSFPDLFEVLSHCAKTLGIPIPHAVTKQGGDFFNAYTVGTDEYALVYISPGLCQFFSKEEACFVIGHECGHIAAGHAMYHTLVQVLTGAITPYLGFIGNLLRATAGVPLMAWSRRSEVTADRAGLLCCGDIAIAERALLRLVVLQM
jgi:Zn-dependent protease with chaperone function